MAKSKYGVRAPEWWTHLRKWNKRRVWKKTRKQHRKEIDNEK